jgi:hypothetical protein
VTAEAHLKTVDIIYRYEARGTAVRPLPTDSDAALRRLNGGNGDFAGLQFLVELYGHLPARR